MTKPVTLRTRAVPRSGSLAIKAARMPMTARGGSKPCFGAFLILRLPASTRARYITRAIFASSEGWNRSCPCPSQRRA